MAAPTPGDMDKCDPKCRCPGGEYSNQAYSCDNPCKDQLGECTFSCETGCDCDDGCYGEDVTAVVTYTKVQYQSDEFDCGRNICNIDCSDRGEFRECGIDSGVTNINVDANQCIIVLSTTWGDRAGGPTESCNSTPASWLEYYTDYLIYTCERGADPTEGECGFPVVAFTSSGCESGFLLDIDVNVS